MSTGLSEVLQRLALRGIEKKAQGESFTPMPGGMPMPGGSGAPPMDPASMGGMPPPPSGPGGQPMDPMMMAAQGMDPAAIMAQQGQPVDPAMAAAGGAQMPAPAAGDPNAAAGAPQIDPMIQQAIDAAVAKATGGGAAPGGAPGAGGKGNAKDAMKIKLDEIHSLLNKMLGVLVGMGKMPSSEIPELEGLGQSEVPPASADGIPPEQKAASIGEMTMTDDSIPAEKQEKVANSLAQLIMALRG